MGTAAADINSRCSCKGSTSFCRNGWRRFCAAFLPFHKLQQVQSAEDAATSVSCSGVAATDSRRETCDLGKSSQVFRIGSLTTYISC